MNDLTDDQKKIADELVALVMQRVYTKIASVLTEEDIQRIEQLNNEDDTGNQTRDFLLTKVPDFDRMFQEEVDLIKDQLVPR